MFNVSRPSALQTSGALPYLLFPKGGYALITSVCAPPGATRVEYSTPR